MADARGDIKDNRIFMGTRWIPIHNVKSGLTLAKFAYPDECLLISAKAGETATEATAIGVWHRELSNLKADTERKKQDRADADRIETVGSQVVAVLSKETKPGVILDMAELTKGLFSLVGQKQP